MTQTGAARTVVVERFGWALTVLAAAACVVVVVCAFSAWADLWTAISWLDPGRPVHVTFDTSVALAPRGSIDQYGGGQYVADGATVTASRITADVSGLSLPVRVGLGVAPLVQDLTIGATALLLLTAVRSLRSVAALGQRTARLLVSSAVVLAVGSTLAQVLLGVSKLGFGHISWAGRDTDDLGGPQTVSFDAGPLVLAIALLAIALLVRRASPVQAIDARA